MKKLLVLLLLVLCIPIAVFADGNRHIVGITKNMEYNVGIDTNSIKVVRYQPPFYIINVDEYHQNFSKGLLGARHTSDGSSEFVEDEDYNTELRLVRKDTMGYLIANYVFYKAYGMYFSKELQDQYGKRDVLKQ